MAFGNALKRFLGGRYVHLWRTVKKALAAWIAVLARLALEGAADQNVRYEVLHNFVPFPNGEGPGNLIQGSDGNLYGTTEWGGSAGAGVIFRLTLPLPQVPGDCNQDGAADLSDAICLFGTLFLGDPARFPCGDGTPGHEANRSLLDWQPDGQVDISDGIGILLFPFTGGPRHPLAVPGQETSACAAITGCPSGPRCP
ncbi:MAG: hypothetical protein HY717_14085 [Planctomycetes bacterium]|nr:hypothetical protein [Planctomycetota bacterium]